jgi:hypothetical protein
VEERDGLFARPGRQREQSRDARPDRIAGSDDDVPAAALRKVGLQQFPIAHVVEDEQPPVAPLELAPDRVDDERPLVLRCLGRLAVAGVLRKVELRREVGVVPEQRGRLLGPDPPDDVIVGAMALGVLERELRLAHAAEPADRLRHDGAAVPAQGGLEPREQVVPAPEVEVAVERDVPRWRERAREARRVNFRKT